MQSRLNITPRPTRNQTLQAAKDIIPQRNRRRGLKKIHRQIIDVFYAQPATRGYKYQGEIKCIPAASANAASLLNTLTIPLRIGEIWGNEVE